MRDRTTYIKLDRNITQWGWFKDDKTFKLFVYLLLAANIKDHVFMGKEIHRGELATSQASLAAATGLSVQSVRTALNHLKSTGDITVNQQAKFAIISIPRYDYYQRNQQAGQQSANRQSTDDQQQSKNDNNAHRGEGARSAQPRPQKMSAYEFALRKAAELAAAGDDEEDDDE